MLHQDTKVLLTGSPLVGLIELKWDTKETEACCLQTGFVAETASPGDFETWRGSLC